MRTRTEYQREYRRSHPDTRTRKEYLRINSRKYYQANREQVLEKRRTHPITVTNHREQSRIRRARLNSSTAPNRLNELWISTRTFCFICYEDIDLSLTWPHPMSFSLDHIIPLSKGGGHTYENVQPAHLVCNMRKHDKVE